MNNGALLTIVIEKIPGGFQARMRGQSACGKTWLEAVGALIATQPSFFGVGAIKYASDPVTRNHLIEWGINERIV